MQIVFRVCQIAFVMVALVANLATAQSLADAARKEQARRKGIKTPSTTYTNADLAEAAPPDTEKPDDPDEPSAPPTGSRAPATPAPAVAPKPEPEKAPAPQQDEKYWRGRITGGRAALARAELFLDALQSRVNALTTDFVARDDPAQRAVIAGDRQKALSEMDRVRAEIQQATDDIAGIEEEARRAGVPPGWLR